jgi:hypothetical protein
MRVNDSTSSPRRSTSATPRGDHFAAALRTARQQKPPPHAGPAAGSTHAAPPLGARRALADRKDAALRDRREGFGLEERQAPPAAARAADSPALNHEVSSVPELRAAVRALPLAIDASRVREGAPLSLSFGRALSVDVRQGPGGVEVLLRADAQLARAASAELPGLVGALRARGLRVARAEVLPQAHGAPAATPPAR